MKIAFLAPFAYSPKATVSARMVPMAAALRERGHELRIFAPPYDNPADSGRTLLVQKVAVENIALPGGAGARAYWSMASQLIAQTRHFQPDVLHVFKPVGPGALAAQRLTRGIFVDNDDWEGAGGWVDINHYGFIQRQFMMWQERALLRRARAITCASHALVQRSHDLAGNAANTLLLPNGPLDSWRDEAAHGIAQRPATRARMGWDQTCIALYAGTVSLNHDLDVLLRAMLTLRNEHIKLRTVFVVAGDGVPALRTLTQELGLSDCVEWHNFMPHAQLVNLLCAADIGVFPYRDTPINRAKCSGKVMDYMNAALPTLAHDVGMMREYVPHEECGWLAQTGDPAQFIEGLRTLATQTSLREQLGARARARLWKYYSWAERIRLLEDAYKIGFQGTFHEK